MLPAIVSSIVWIIFFKQRDMRGIVDWWTRGIPPPNFLDGRCIAIVDAMVDPGASGATCMNDGQKRS